MQTPIQITTAAIAHIKTMLSKQQNAIGFRLSIKKTGCSGYAYLPDIIEAINPTDIHFVTEDLLVYIDKNSLSLLEGVTIDYIEEKSDHGLKQKRLVFINPHEKGRCGCGESFNV